MSIDLDAIEARANAATSGPWKATHSKGDCGNCKPCPKGLFYCNDECEQCEHWGITEPAWVKEILTVDCGEFDYMNDADADFIAHAREDIPALLAEVRRQAAEIASVTAERDEAVEDLRKNRAKKCDCCAYAGRSERWPCVDCQSSISNYGDGWKWRGAGKEQKHG